MNNLAAIILAAGRGTRMKSDLCKVLHNVAGLPMIGYVVEAARSAGLARIAVVVGHQAKEVEKSIAHLGVEFVLQEPQLGTGHAVAATKQLFQGFDGHILILCGDVPLVEAATLEDFASYHVSKNSRLTVMTTVLDDPAGYGRIVRNESREVLGIVEDRDADPVEKKINEVNTGIYIVEAGLLYDLIDGIDTDNSQAEYYLTDILSEAVKSDIQVYGYILAQSREVAGVNTRADLAKVSRTIWDRRRAELMESGVTLLDPDTVYVDARVKVGADTVIHPGVTLGRDTKIGRHCLIEPGVYITDSTIGDRVSVRLGSRLDGAMVEEGTTVGPMAHLRPEAEIGKNARIGNFVEVKKSRVGDGSKASHLTYLGDSTIGKEVNIGCGTITCNYDGRKKHHTTIRDKCFIGSDVQFVAPVEIGEGSVIGAGSTITKDVPPSSLAVSRAKQKSYPLRNGQGPKRSDEDRKS
jgi:bifunctional UDP-N-acetylglucosamine pyrophosphorylase / glucosamine-1-phosphate N-acetyltransferase